MPTRRTLLRRGGLAVATAGLAGCSAGGGTGDGNGSSAGPAWTATRSVVERLRHAVTSTPVVSNGTLYVPTYADGLYALDPESGELRWHVGLSVTDGVCVHDGAVYVGDAGTGETVEQLMATDGRAYAFDAETGEPLWETSVSGNPISEPVVRDGAVYLGARSHGLHVLDAASGESSRSLPFAQGVGNGGFAVRDGVVYVGSRRRTLAVDLDGGETLWEVYTDEEPDPLRLEGDRFYVETGSELAALAPDSGESVWSTAAEAAGLAVGSAVYAALVGTPGLAAFDPSSGAERWRRSLPARPQGPALGDGTLVVPTRAGTVHYVDAPTGRERTVLRVSESAGSTTGDGAGSTPVDGAGPLLSCSPAWDGDALYVGDRSGTVYALRDDGEAVRWRTDLSAVE
ncbi:PQQ-binding-like beta-propeller repeat protein [Halosimplex pelagicum]|uniref:PQQ-binding-like beta-propeller repeat protein n=1 Tax=Halosimplex pelagicum TaxID=869886 RepID=A0A7D5P659_9EURY|nr:PQQ-binding-like beta-propeller repeat protein [Halosimplex pelagicum]QLH81877.1 PQQ-binding-like beta-propeller repeat protein [Halosimplex pelagicum]